jgi:SpoVK/Ycf46/Vps4 family AAA+-type ATPase
MSSRKRSRDYTMKPKRGKKVKLTAIDTPPASSISDLIDMSNSLAYYSNIDTLMLWRITPHLIELNKLIGLKTLKETIFFQVIYYLQGLHIQSREGNNEEYLHTAITGPPGHGKTVVAEIICKLYQSMGVLSDDGPFKIARREDLVGEYLGTTAMKTRALLESCIGGCLFIDEVYALSAGNKDRDSFAKEAIDTITGFLSEHKNDFCCIIAGYKEEVDKCFFDMNPGLRRRFPWMHNIEPYKPAELVDIFLKMVGDIGWSVNVEKDMLLALLTENKELFKHAGGDIENFISKMKMFHSRRVFSSKDEKKAVNLEDVKETIAYMRDRLEVGKGPPLGMYM